MQPDFDALPVVPEKVNKKPSYIRISLYTLFFLMLVAICAEFFYSHFHTTVRQASAALKDASLPAAEDVYNNYTWDQFSWKPDYETASSSAQKFQLSAKAALVMNLDTDKVYFAKNPTLRLPMASLTKEMTALLAYERTKSSDVFTISAFASQVGENTMGAQTGQRYTVDDLLHALFLQSANDAAEVLGESIGGSEQQFITMMNKRAKDLGMTDTNYTDPYGLTSAGQYTSAQDLAIITKYFMLHYPQALGITKLLEYTIPAATSHPEVDLVGQIDLVRTYPGVIGFKTGFTDEAGYCIVTIAENRGVRLMAIVLGSANRKIDAVKMLDYAYQQEGITINHQPFW